MIKKTLKSEFLFLIGSIGVCILTVINKPIAKLLLCYPFRLGVFKVTLVLPFQTWCFQIILTEFLTVQTPIREAPIGNSCNYFIGLY